MSQDRRRFLAAPVPPGCLNSRSQLALSTPEAKPEVEPPEDEEPRREATKVGSLEEGTCGVFAAGLNQLTSSLHAEPPVEDISAVETGLGSRLGCARLSCTRFFYFIFLRSYQELGTEKRSSRGRVRLPGPQYLYCFT